MRPMRQEIIELTEETTQQGVSRRNFIKGAIAASAAVSSANYLFRANGGALLAQSPAAGAVERLITLNINGRSRRLEVPPMETLGFTLRYKLGLTGTKIGCDRAECGACTVLVDGVPLYSCSLLTHTVRGREVTTIEGLEAEDGTLHPVQQGVLDEGGFQCAFCAPGFHPMADGIALEGLRLIATWLPRAVADGSDLRARAHMLAAASMGAVAFQKGLGAVHALSHPVGAVLGAHHGVVNGVLLPYVLSFNRSVLSEKLPLLARSLDLGETFDDVLDWLLRLRDEIGIPSTLAALGVSESMVAQLAPMAADDPTCAGNPAAVDEAQLASIYVHAIRGELD